MGPPSDSYFTVSCTALGIKRVLYDLSIMMIITHLSPRWKFGKIDEPLLRPSKISSPDRNILHKDALRRVAQNKNILLWLQICPSHNSLKVRLVSTFINISRQETRHTRGRNTTDL